MPRRYASSNLPIATMMVTPDAMIDTLRMAARMHVLSLSEREVARQLGMSLEALDKFKHGESRSSRRMDRLARVLKTTPAYLKGEVDDPDLDVPAPPSSSPSEP
jgi:transcriptional regulator with XRE-family HTH domain